MRVRHHSIKKSKTTTWRSSCKKLTLKWWISNQKFSLLRIWPRIINKLDSQLPNMSSRSSISPRIFRTSILSFNKGNHRSLNGNNNGKQSHLRTSNTNSKLTNSTFRFTHYQSRFTNLLSNRIFWAHNKHWTLTWHLKMKYCETDCYN